ncbi:Ribosomal L2 C domain-containing protein [Citrus sinensis]|uniref:Ribosomal L2 C domain-containing protein n=1 Tax=Citrus sinensis TaxID=2711 RepID=A0ACB8MB60_CITSI|nr:Ribosomal L2 C domain-containing protein [Citrus sinensis]
MHEFAYRLTAHPSSPTFYRLILVMCAFETESVGDPSKQEKPKKDVVRDKIMRQMAHVDINTQVGSCMPLACMRTGTIIHKIEVYPAEGGKLVRAAATSAKILKKTHFKVLLNVEPTIGTVSNPSHGATKLRKAGQSRWLGRRPVVGGVAMNPVDHPHGGGEGRSKSSRNHGRCSLTPWGKPCNSGYKTAFPKGKKKKKKKLPV